MLFLTGISASNLSKVKPRQYGPISYVQSVVRHNAERMGIDPVSLIGYWPFWEKGGGIAHNVSMYGNNGALQNGTTWVNNGLGFDGTNDHIIVNNIYNPSTLSVGLWVYYNSKDTNEWFINKRARLRDGEQSWQLYKYDNQLAYSLIDSSGYDIGRASTVAPDGQYWYFLVGTTEGVTNGFVKLYLDGNLVDSSTLVGDMNLSTLNVHIAKIGWKDEFHLEGKIDVPFICNSVLTSDQVAHLNSYPYALLQRPWTTPPIIFDVNGELKTTFSAKSPGASFSGRTPGTSFSGKGPRINFQ